MLSFLSISRLRRVAAGGVALALLAGASPASAELIQLRSGIDADSNSRDDNVTLLKGPIDGPFGATFSPADFTAASTGEAAWLVSVLNANWKTSLDSDPAAKWIGIGFVNPANGWDETTAGIHGFTALYAIDFTITQTEFANVFLDFDYLVDDGLGEGGESPLNPAGLYVNGTALAGSTDVTAGNSANDQSFPAFDITSLVSVGSNTLYIYDNDFGGGAAGLNFSARVSVVDEPAAVGALGLALLALGVWRRRRRG